MRFKNQALNDLTQDDLCKEDVVLVDQLLAHLFGHARVCEHADLLRDELPVQLKVGATG